MGELCTISKGHGYSKADIRDAGTPLILYGRLYTQYEARIENVDTFAVEQEGSLLSKGNEVIVPASGETAEDIAVASSVRRSGIIFGGDLNVVTPVSKLDPDYIALAITYSKAHDDLAKRAQGKSVVHVHGNDIAEVEIPYPSESEQKRISTVVLGLDSLITLHQRKCQYRGLYGYLSWEQRKLGEVATRHDNLRIPITAKDRIPGDTPYYGANGIQDYVEGYTHEGEFVLVAEDGATDLDNYPVQLISGLSWVNNHAHVIKAIPDVAQNRFIMYLIKSMDIASYLVGGTRSKLNAEVLMGIELKLPSNSEQIYIGALLSTLDSLITLHQ